MFLSTSMSRLCLCLALLVLRVEYFLKTRSISDGCWWPGSWFNIKMSSYEYRTSHCGDKMVLRSSYLHNGISYTGKMSSLYLYWIRALASGRLMHWSYRSLVLNHWHVYITRQTDTVLVKSLLQCNSFDFPLFTLVSTTTVYSSVYTECWKYFSGVHTKKNFQLFCQELASFSPRSKRVIWMHPHLKF